MACSHQPRRSIYFDLRLYRGLGFRVIEVVYGVLGLYIVDRSLHWGDMVVVQDACPQNALPRL